MSQCRFSSSGCNKNTGRCRRFNHISIRTLQRSRMIPTRFRARGWTDGRTAVSQPWDSAGRQMRKSWSRPESKAGVGGGCKGRRWGGNERQWQTSQTTHSVSLRLQQVFLIRPRRQPEQEGFRANVSPRTETLHIWGWITIYPPHWSFYYKEMTF